LIFKPRFDVAQPLVGAFAMTHPANKPAAAAAAAAAIIRCARPAVYAGCWKQSSFGCYTCVTDSYHC
jgi:hypothetical protein